MLGEPSSSLPHGAEEPGHRVAAALPASLVRTRPRAWRVFLARSRRPPLSDGGGGGVTALPPDAPLVRARTRVEIAIPIAVRMLTSVTPCSPKRVRRRSASVVPSWRIRLMVSHIRLIWERRASLFAAAASSRADLSTWRSRRRSAIWRLLNSSMSPASSFCLSKAMWSSSWVSFARLLVSSPLMVCRALSSPRISCRLSEGSLSIPRSTLTSASVRAVSILCTTSEVSVAICPRSRSSTVSTAAAASPSCWFSVWRDSTALAGKLDFFRAQSTNPAPRGSQLPRQAGWQQLRGHRGPPSFCWPDRG